MPIRRRPIRLGVLPKFFAGRVATDEVLAAHEKATISVNSPEALTSAIAAQLRQCLAALESKQPELIIGVC